MRSTLGILGGAAAAALLVTAGPAPAAPDCAPFPKSRVVLETGDVLENVYMDGRQRLFYSDQSANALMRLDRLGSKPKALTAVPTPGGIAEQPGGALIVGYGDGIGNGPTGDQNPMAGLYRINPNTGAHSTFATGLGMANGVARGPDGALYATNDFGHYIDRVKNGHVMHPWANVYSTNGVVVSRDNRYVYVDQTFVPAAIQRISVAHPSQVTQYVAAEPADYSAGLDSMQQDEHGNLYVAANGGGQVWKVDSHTHICVLASGLQFPSAVAFGTGPYVRNLYVVTFAGQIVELSAVRPKPAPATGTIVGRVIFRRGPRDRLHSTSARVTLRHVGRVVARRRVHSGHRYRFKVAPGRYRLTGRSDDADCAARRVTVRAGRRAHANLVCSIS
jgi:gluconolactonase